MNWFNTRFVLRHFHFNWCISMAKTMFYYMELLHPSAVILLQGFCSIDHDLHQVIMPFHSNSAFVRHSTVQCIPYSFFARGYFMVEAIFVPQAFWLIKCSTPTQIPIMSNSYISRWVGGIWPNTSLLQNWIEVLVGRIMYTCKQNYSPIWESMA